MIFSENRLKIFLVKDEESSLKMFETKAFYRGRDAGEFWNHAASIRRVVRVSSIKRLNEEVKLSKASGVLFLSIRILGFFVCSRFSFTLLGSSENVLEVLLTRLGCLFTRRCGLWTAYYGAIQLKIGVAWTDALRHIPTLLWVTGNLRYL